ncbi:hypothetical protein M9H77_03476 [Catharanthus roseus]|uniref:Uncharacterized protein n=1 Tax=Catharanthus roseus TaxID=4058 RepID=A0ACC0CBR5_CATRO|nr:hypothetical protein M9H77_03476 [Catharanthus roseus]
MGVRLFCNRALVWCLAGIDYEMLELCFDDLVKGFGLCPWSPTIALHVLLNLGVEAALMCHDSLRLSSCARNPHTWSFGSSLSGRSCVSILLSCTLATCKFSAERHVDTLLSRS